MKKFLAIVLCVAGLSGCATLKSMDENLFYRQNQESKLAAAVKLQTDGRLAAATDAFISLCAERPLAGVTDEALFRLSLLYLGSGLENDRETAQLAYKSLERLRKEFPTSPWTGMAAPVTELLNNTGELRRQNQSCKSQNQSLARENQALSKEAQELRQSIEKLKQLDLELEQKRK